MPTTITGIDTEIKSGGVIDTAKTRWFGSILSSNVYAYDMPTKSTAPPAIIMAPICFEPYFFAMINDVPVKINAGAIPIEINCKTFGAGSTSR